MDLNGNAERYNILKPNIHITPCALVSKDNLIKFPVLKLVKANIALPHREIHYKTVKLLQVV
jgi:hypothetical protein